MAMTTKTTKTMRTRIASRRLSESQTKTNRPLVFILFDLYCDLVAWSAGEYAMRWIAILSALVLGACSAVPENSPQRETQESISQKITKGKTTKADVKSMFGEPVSTTSKERGAEEWHYKMASSSSTVKIPGFEKFFGSSADNNRTLLVDFDRRGIVTSYSLD